MSEEPPKKTCFVVMGFGEKTDFRQQKTFDLDKTYRIIIKKAVEAAGLECIRADDIDHSGTIDAPMYQQLLNADVVVADLSTSNENAIYELGVRHALRPQTTIVIAEKGFKFPFDIGHLLVRTYEHLGSGIDAEEAEAFRDGLTETIRKLADEGTVDSPVYTFLPNLAGPGESSPEGADPADLGGEQAPQDDQTVGMLMDMFRAARADSNWGGVKMAMGQLRAKLPTDPFVLQQLALATYKDKSVDAKEGLDEAKEILSALRPETSKDPETLGIWGAIHKRFWELNGDTGAMNEAVESYGRGYNLRGDYYNGINYAYMLDARAAVSGGEDAIADRVWARRTRMRIIDICEDLLESDIKDDDGNVDPEQTFWVRATLVEALLGAGQKGRSDAVMEEAVAAAPEPWMRGTLEEQLGKLTRFLEAAPAPSD